MDLTLGNPLSLVSDQDRISPYNGLFIKYKADEKWEYKREKKRRSVTYIADQDNKVSTIFIKPLGLDRGWIFHLKQTFKLSVLYSDMTPA